jgi:predicted phosphodiesterase
MGKARFRKLSMLFDQLEAIPFDPQEDKFVIFSDQHIGMKEFEENKELYLKALDYYYHQGFKLVVIGDFEELHRFGIKALKDKYRNDVYDKEFKYLREGRYYRIFGNHDIDWKIQKRVEKDLGDILPELKIVEGIKFKWNENFIFLTHGHQGEFINDALGKVGRLFLRWIAHPLGFSSFTSSAKNYRKRRKSETEYYNWAKSNKIIFIAGHTHRPMFESLTKIDRIRIDIENKIRKYLGEKDSNKMRKLEKEIEAKREELLRVREIEGEKEQWPRLEQTELLIPCYFNDGSCLHRNGITCIELSEGKIRLIFLFDKRKKENRKKHLRGLLTSKLEPKNPRAAHYMHQILEEEELEYIFARIQLLSLSEGSN